MTPDSAEQSDNPAGDATHAGAPPASDTRGTVSGWLWNKARNFLIDWLATAMVLAAGLAVLAFVLPEPENLQQLQHDLWTSVAALNPMSLAEAAFELGMRFFGPVREGFGTVFGFIGWIREGILRYLEDAFSLSPGATALIGLALNVALVPIVIPLGLLLVLLAVAYLFVSVFVAPITLFFGVSLEGDPLAAVILTLVYLPLIWSFGRFAIKDPELDGKARALVILFTPGTALIVATLFFGALQLAMLGAIAAFGWFIPEPSTSVAGSGIGAFCYQCTAKAADSSITNNVAAVFKKALRQ